MTLAGKFLAAFALVALVAVGTVSIVANQAAVREVRIFMVGRGMTDSDLLTQELAAYYRGRGEWQGVEVLFDSPGRGHGPGGGGGMMHGGTMADPILADAAGRIILGSQGLEQSSLSKSEMDSSMPIEVDGATVGYLLLSTDDVRAADADLIQRLNRATWLAALLAGAAALLVGGLLALSLLRPVRELTRAVQALAQGNLGQRVRVRSGDEIGELSKAFNQMAGNLERAETLRRDMTADIAHELRNPLAVMQARVEGILDGIYPPTQENLEPVLMQSVLLNRLVEDLRTLAQAESGELQLDPTPTDLVALAQRTLDSYRPQADAAGIALQLDIKSSVELIAHVDPMRMEQVLGNLLSNALRYTPEGGEVRVSMNFDPAGRKVILVVADSGEGIPPEALDLIFERFYRTDPVRARQAGGSGLGLTIARRLVEAQGGDLRAANQPEGGARFSIELPLARD